MAEKKEDFIIMIKVNQEGSNYKASGNMTTGMIKLMIGEMEHIKSRLLFDLEKTLNEGYNK